VTDVCFVVESGTDVRLVEGLAARCALTVLARQIAGGTEVSRPPSIPVTLDIGPGSRLRFAAWAGRRLGARRFDAVLVQGYGPAALAANLAARRTGARTVMLVCSPVEAYYRCRRRDHAAGKPFRRSELLGLALMARLNARAGQRYVVLSAHLGDVVRAHGGRLPVDVIPVYGVDTERFRPVAIPRSELRRRRGLPERGAIAFFSSRVAPEKDAATLLHALRLLTREGRDLRLLHRSGGHRRFLELAAEYGVGDRVIASDAVHPHDELPLDYLASDLCVQASRAEGLGFSPLEAMACGIPVVATAVGGLAETVQDGKTGWTYAPGDVAGLARAIAAVLDDPAEGCRRALAGRAMVCARFERNLVFDRLAAVLEGRPGAP
jgi:glycosyltransferase involved in cell wall biosynthesis